MDQSSKDKSEQGGPTWAELLGRDDWKGLLDPLHMSLRRLICRCGDFIQATYDTFINDQNSKYCGASRYGKKDFFQKVMMENGEDYRVVGFLYGTARVSEAETLMFHSMSREAWDRESNWIGFIAVTSDEKSQQLGRREIYVAWRGTIRDYEWINVLGAAPESIESLLNTKDDNNNVAKGNGDKSSSSSDDDDDEKVPKVMKGWVTVYITDDPKSSFTKLSARTQLHHKLTELRELYKGENLSITFVGHSLGASLSILSAFDVVENGIRDIPVAAFVFGCPGVGNKAFDDRCNRYPNLKFLHVRNKIDLIPHYPGKLLGYTDSWVKLQIDTRKSPYLKDSKNPSDWHNLQALVHIVAGWTGEKGKFELKVKRSVALVNKSCDFLKDECLVPGAWWVEKNKGMVLKDGEWIMDDPAEEDRPVPEF
ncbi:phospholipase A1-IIdelta [Punica granatum]|uniref:Phospholipase A1 n=2 Tax=Punica granatum TaxID=22663 RepID=A0A218WLG0_PUNGR|nr:phospholipase A1-IIdelta [Punica granatum]OWM73338.1 hypothetical protein CDL15_Pgr001452 [Punica granatum]PKI62882.1 hypothetical protein CRG98_016719 [Punica granatum]